MNIFRKFMTEDLVSKVQAYETQIADLETSYQSLLESNQKLSDQIVELTQSLQVKEEVIEQKTEEIEVLEEKVEEVEKVVEEKQEIIEEVIENVVSVEKQAAIKALEILADCGITESVEVIEAPENIDIMDQFKKLKGKELADFYQKHRQEIVANLKK